ncbi:MAG: hypothetical protein KJ626_05205 [Verrucomicrobia bacterium]|nr:hypothetical protein [Verrucomicrobiota bacterium]
MTNNEMNLGTQPLDQVLTELKLGNHDLVNASTEHLTHKMVNKGRKGRRLTRNIQTKIMNALNAAAGDRTFSIEELFNYRGKA